MVFSRWRFPMAHGRAGRVLHVFGDDCKFASKESFHQQQYMCIVTVTHIKPAMSTERSLMEICDRIYVFLLLAGTCPDTILLDIKWACWRSLILKPQQSGMLGWSLELAFEVVVKCDTACNWIAVLPPCCKVDASSVHWHSGPIYAKASTWEKTREPCTLCLTLFLVLLYSMYVCEMPAGWRFHCYLFASLFIVSYVVPSPVNSGINNTG